MPTVMFMKESGKMIRLMVKESTIIPMELNMRAIGEKINNMVMVLKHGQMERATKGSIKMERKMDMESFCGLMVQLIKDNSLIIISSALPNSPLRAALPKPCIKTLILSGK